MSPREGSPVTASGTARTPALVLTLVCGALAVVAAAAGFAPDVRQLTGLALFACVPLAVLAGMRRFRPVGAAAWVWRGVAAYTLLNLVGSALAFGFAQGGVDVLPVWVNGFWLLGNVVLVAVLSRVLLPRGAADRQVVLLDLVALVASAGLILGAVMLDRFDAEGIDDLAPIGYVAVDVVLLALVVRLAVSARFRPRAGGVLAAAVAGLVCSDMLWQWSLATFSYVPNAWADLGWLAQAMLMALAASHRSMARVADRSPAAERRSSTASAVVLGLGSLAAPVLLVLQSDHTIELHGSIAALPVLGGGVLIAVVVCWRGVAHVRRADLLAAQLASALDERGRRLDSSEQRYRSLVEQLPGVVYIAGYVPGSVSELYHLYVSPQVEPMLGISPDDWLVDPGSVLRVTHPDDRGRLRAHAAQIVGGDEPRAFEFRVVRPDGTTLWISSEYSYFSDDAGNPLVQGIMLDVTARRHALDERDRMETDLRLAQKLESVGQLAAGIAHEINTPIQFVGDTVHFLDDAFRDLLELIDAYDGLHAAVAGGEPVPPDVLAVVAEARELAEPEYLRDRVPAAFGRAFDGVGRVSRIVRAMREFGHPPTTEKAPVDVNAAIETTLVVAANEYKYVADTELRLGEVPTLLGNAGDLNQVLLNLVVNAAHAIQDRVGDSGERGRITISTAQDGADVVLSVADDGCGMPPEVAARVFDPFFTTKAVGRGTGQGLAIIHRAVTQRHGGTISFDSAPGAGTTFQVRLPLDGGEHAGPSAEAIAA